MGNFKYSGRTSCTSNKTKQDNKEVYDGIINRPGENRMNNIRRTAVDYVALRIMLVCIVPIIAFIIAVVLAFS